MVSASETARRARLRLAGLSGRTLLAMLAVAVVVAAADRSRLRLDLSADHRFSIAESLARILAEQREPVELVGIWPRRLNDGADPVIQAVTRIAARYPRVTWRRIDPELDKPALAAFKERYHDDSSPTLQVCRNDRAYKIQLTASTRLILQQELGGALVSLADPHPPSAVLLQGHGELRPHGGDDDGCDRLAGALHLGGFQVEIRPVGEIKPLDPEAVLVVAGPLKPLGPDCDRVAEHLRDGGGVLLLADDRMPNDLGILLRRRGIFMGPQIPKATVAVNFAPRAWFDPAAPVFPPGVIASMHHFADHASATGYLSLQIDSGINQDHPASRGVAVSGRSLLSPLTTPSLCLILDLGGKNAELDQLKADLAERKIPPFHCTELLATAAQDTWITAQADRRMPDQLAPDPSNLAWAVDYAPAENSVRQGHGARLVVWGSRQAAADGTLSREEYANADFLTDCARWLSGHRPNTGIPTAETKAFRVEASERTLSLLVAALVAILPCAFIGVAIIAWWERR